MNGERFELEQLDEEDPFEIDSQAAHLFKNPHLGIDDGWASDPVFYPAKPPAHWLMCAEIGGRVLVVPLAPARSGDRDGAVRSAATTRRISLPPSTGGTDDEHPDDT